MTPPRLPVLLPSAPVRAGQGLLDGPEPAFIGPEPSAEGPDAGLHARLLADLQAGAAGPSDAVVLAYSAYLLATWHAQGLATLDPDTDTGGAEEQADTWTRAVLAFMHGRPRDAGADDAEVIAVAVQLLVQPWPEEALNRFALRLTHLVQRGEFRHVETAFVLRDLIAPQLEFLEQAACAREAVVVAHALLAAHWSAPDTRADVPFKLVSSGY